MKMYIFKDAEIADQLRELGFSIITTQNSGETNFAVIQCEKLDDILNGQFSQYQFLQTDTVCF